MIADAKAGLRAVEAALAPAPVGEVRKWLTGLGTLSAGQMSLEDARAKIGAYAALLDAPVFVLTTENLKEAGKKFTWFPSFGEVAAFLDGKTAELRRTKSRLAALANAAPTPKIEKTAKPWSQRSQEERDRFDQMMKKAFNSLAVEEKTPDEAK